MHLMLASTCTPVAAALAFALRDLITVRHGYSGNKRLKCCAKQTHLSCIS